MEKEGKKVEAMPFPAPENRNQFFAFLSDLFGQSADGVLACDAELKVIWVNSRLVSFFNQKKGDLTGRKVDDLVREYLPGSTESGETQPARESGETSAEEELYVPPTEDRPESWLRRRSQPIPSGVFAGGRIEFFSEITSFKKAGQDLRRREAFEAMVAKISTRFIELPVNDIDRGINYALESLGNFAEVDRCQVFRFSADGEEISNTHEWCAPGIESARERRRSIPASDFPWAVEKIRTRRSLYIPRVSELPESASIERERWENRGLQSLLGVPLVAGGELVGFLGFESVRQEKFWEEKDLILLETVGGIIGNSLERQRSEGRLRESEEKYRLLVENQGDLVVKMDRDGNFLFVSPSYCVLFGFSEEELLDKSFFPLVHPEDREATARAMAAVLNPPFKTYLEQRALTRFGWRWLAWLNTGIPDPEGRVTAIIAAGRDITERRRAEEALRESEERFRTLVEHAADAFFIHDGKGHFLDVNPRACECLGYSREELLQLSVKDIDTTYGPRWAADLWGRTSQGRPMTIHGCHRRRDGSTFPVEVRVSLVETDTNRFFFALARDVSERMRAEETLRAALAEAEESRDKIDGILRSVADGVIVTDPAYRVTLMNRTAEDLLRGSRVSADPRLLDEIVPIGALKSNLKAAFSSNSPVTLGEFEISVSEEGAPRVIQARTSLIRGKRGRKAGAITILQDVTRQREVDRLKSEFISTAAHELRTPLTSIQGFSEVLLEDRELGDFERRKYLSYIHEQAVGISKIVSDLLDISRVEAGRTLSLNRVSCQVGACIRKIVPFLRWQPTICRFEIDLVNESAEWSVDAAKINQVMENLVSNAVKYSPGGGVIRIGGRLLKGSYAVSVRDQGRGMTPEQVERIFEKFFRADSSNTAVGGIGLGMSIVKNIIEAHGGEIDVISDPGKGTTVTFSIPVGN